MGRTIKFTDFQDWLDACANHGLEFADIKEDFNEYFFEVDGYKMAYWDREHKFGYISEED